MERQPDAIFVVDVRREENACREAVKKGIPVVAICDTNADLFLVNYPIPGNDDAIKAIEIIVETIGAAYKEGREAFEKKSAKQKVELAGEKAVDVVKREAANTQKAAKGNEEAGSAS